MDIPFKNGGSFHSYVSHYQRVSGIPMYTTFWRNPRHSNRCFTSGCWRIETCSWGIEQLQLQVFSKTRNWRPFRVRHAILWWHVPYHVCHVMWEVYKIPLSFHSTGWFSAGFLYWVIRIPNILGSIITYNHQGWPQKTSASGAQAGCHAFLLQIWFRHCIWASMDSGHAHHFSRNSHRELILATTWRCTPFVRHFTLW